jgi:hypothetical protein
MLTGKHDSLAPCARHCVKPFASFIACHPAALEYELFPFTDEEMFFCLGLMTVKREAGVQAQLCLTLKHRPRTLKLCKDFLERYIQPSIPSVTLRARTAGKVSYLKTGSVLFFSLCLSLHYGLVCVVFI